MAPKRASSSRSESPPKRRHFIRPASPTFEVVITTPRKEKKPPIRSKSEDDISDSSSLEIQLLLSPTDEEDHRSTSTSDSDASTHSPGLGGTPLPKPPGRRTWSPAVEDPPTFNAQPPSFVPQSPVIYDVADDELIEDGNLQIIGETDPNELSEDGDSDTQSEVPVRLFKDFVIYDLATNEVVPVAALTQVLYDSSNCYGASGTVEAWRDDDNGDEDDDGVDDLEDLEEEESYTQRVKLSRIMEFNVHHFRRTHRSLDSKIYIRTAFAWYILDTPSTIYSPFFSPFWIQHRILHLIVTQSWANPRLTYDTFIKSLEITPESPDSVAIAIKVIGRSLTESDVQSDNARSYIVSVLQDLLDQNNITLNRVPVIRTIRGIDVDDGIEPPSPPHTKRKSSRKKNSQVFYNVEQDVLQHKNQTVVTPRVGRIAQGLFELTLRVAGRIGESDDEDEELAQAIKHAKAHHQDPVSMKWVEDAEDAGCYNSVVIDGEVYTVGDVVMVHPGTDENQARARNATTEGAQTTNSLGNHLWFCKIWHFFQEKNQKWFHGQWLAHGSKTLLQETAHSQSLFLMDSCDDIPLASIFQKCNLRWLLPDDDEPPEDDRENNFHCGLMWNEEESSFTDLPTESDIDSAIASCPERVPCVPCGLKAQQEVIAQMRPLPGGGFSQFGQNYHTLDFVYVKPSPPDSRYKIAQIAKIEAMKTPALVTVVYFGRYDDICKKSPSPGVVSDERRLFKTSRSSLIKSDDIDGICYVSHLTNSQAINEWVRHDDHYYSNQIATPSGELHVLDSDDFRQCKRCFNDRINRLHFNEQLCARHQPLRGLELFSGAGGLGTGFDMSGFVETRVAIEFSPSAANTYALNHPQTTVFNQCTNLLLQHAIDCYEGKNPPPLFSLHDGQTRLKAMPKPGDIDFIYGGPPCQSFSGANRWKKANDIRSTLVCNMLSYVEFYRPSYFQLENVTGLLQYPLNGRQVERTIVDGIKMGVVKFIERSLIALGYQVSLRILQAGQYGSPQSRKRVIFWGAMRGILLPNFPLPTHTFKGSCCYWLPTGGSLHPMTRSRNPHIHHQFTPFNPVSVNDAISDLPPFDWESPYRTCPATAQDTVEVAHRAQQLGIPALRAHWNMSHGLHNNVPGYSHPVPYAHPPQNRYQMWLRAESGDNVEYHYTQRLAADVVERTWNIPLRPYANHTALPAKLRPRRFDGRSVVPTTDVIYGRLDANGFFRTAMTTIAPTHKGSQVIHPTQKRILTVRECARAQGFPDDYRIVSVNQRLGHIVQDQHRQIGNAVPVPLALALGKSLGEVLLKIWADEERAGSPEV